MPKLPTRTCAISDVTTDRAETATGDVRANDTQNPPAGQAAQRRAELGERVAQFGERDGTREVLSTPCGRPYPLCARRSSSGRGDPLVSGATWISL
jgi:hypothetical protein